MSNNKFIIIFYFTSMNENIFYQVKLEKYSPVEMCSICCFTFFLVDDVNGLALERMNESSAESVLLESNLKSISSANVSKRGSLFIMI